MKNSIKFLTCIFLIGIITTIFSNDIKAQDVLSVEEMNSVYKKELTLNKKVQAYTPLREADVIRLYFDLWFSLKKCHTILARDSTKFWL